MYDFSNILTKLDTSMENLKIISDNIANVNTPNYKKKYLSNNGFENVLKMKKDYSNHLDGINENSYTIKEDSRAVREDGNSVDINQEISDLTKNNLQYVSFLRIFNKDISLAKSVIGSK